MDLKRKVSEYFATEDERDELAFWFISKRMTGMFALEEVDGMT